jgi:hypothetical protein
MTFSRKQLTRIIYDIGHWNLRLSHSFEDSDLNPFVIFQPASKKAIFKHHAIAVLRWMRGCKYEPNVVLSPDDVYSALKFLKEKRQSIFAPFLGSMRFSKSSFRALSDYQEALDELERAAEGRFMPPPPKGLCRPKNERYIFKGM